MSDDSTPVFFWRECEEPYGFLSQWFESPFDHEGVTYSSTEMWMMIQKAKLFGDEVCLCQLPPACIKPSLDISQVENETDQVIPRR